MHKGPQTAPSSGTLNKLHTFHNLSPEQGTPACGYDGQLLGSGVN